MFAHTQNRTLLSYILTQSALMLIVLAASFLIVDLMAFYFGWQVSRFGLSLSLILLVQLPVSTIFAKSEARAMTASEGWAFGAFFGLTTVGFEATVQVLSGWYLDFTWVQHVLPAQSKAEVLGLVLACLFLLIGGSACLMKILLRSTVNVRLSARRNLTFGDLPRHRGRKSFDVAEHFRRELIGLNILIFGVSLACFGPDYLHILKLSIPASIVFGVVCVANQMAKLEPFGRLSNRCLAVSIQMLPLTLTCLLLLGIGETYSVLAGSMSHGPWDIARTMGVGFAQDYQILLTMALNIGLIAACVVAGNTMLLLLFSKLIRPMIVKTQRPKVQELLEKTRLKPAEACVLMTSLQMRQALAKRVERTKRPAQNPHSVRALLAMA